MTDPEVVKADTALPAASGDVAIWDLVIADMQDRDALGYRKYGKRLKLHDGRDTLQDAYEEALDLAVYLKKALIERLWPNPAARS